MKTSLVRTCLDTSRIDLFNGTLFKRWLEMVFYVIDVVNMRRVLTNLKPKDNS